MHTQRHASPAHVVLTAIVVSLGPEELVDLVGHRVVRVVGEVRSGLVARYNKRQGTNNGA